MKKFKLFLFAFYALLFSIVVFSGCEIGMGEEVDLEAPTLRITSPSLNANTKRNVELKGTCIDNQKVESVIVYNYFTNEKIQEAIISGTDWQANLYLPEGDQTLKVVATDKANNSSTKSIKVITLHVDEEAPKGLSWYIDRGSNIQTPLYSFEELKSFDFDLAANKHIPQNQIFTIKARFFDTMGMVKTTLILEEVEENANGEIINVDSSPLFKIERDLDSYKEAETKLGTLYMPFFEFDHDILKSKKASLNSGKHYFRVSYYAKDKAGNEHTVEVGYFLWWPESDIPGIEVKDVEKTDAVEQFSINVGGVISLHFFDDDKLGETAYTFRPSGSLNGLTQSNIKSKKGSFENRKTDYATGVTDAPLSVNVGDITGVFYLAAYVQDDHEKEKTRWIEVTVTDAQKPILVVTEPQENQVPTITNNTKFYFKGSVSDTSGCSNIKIAYVPKTDVYNDSTKLESRAKQLFDGSSKVGKESVKSKELNERNTGNQKFVKENFTFEYDILSDFGDEKNKDKFFLIRLEDIDGNIVYKPYIVLGDTSSPSIIMKSPEKDMVVVDYTKNDLTLKFKAEKDSGLGIDATKYKITRKVDNTETSVKEFSSSEVISTGVDTGYVSYTIPKANLKSWAEGATPDTQPIFTFYAEDVLGNKATERRVVVLSPLPSVEKITSDKQSGIYNTGTELKIYAKFTDTVKLDKSKGSPRLLLGGIKDKNGNSLNNQYANLHSTTQELTDTLIFAYIVPQDVQSSMITVESTIIDLNGATIKTGGTGEGDAIINIPTESSKTLQASAILQIDSIKPQIKSVQATVLDKSEIDSKYYVKENDEITLQIEFTEPILISGSPVLVIKGDESNTYNFNFQQMLDGGKSVKFTYKVKTGNSAQSLSLDKKTAFSNTDVVMIKDLANNSLQLSSATDSVVLPLVMDTTKPNKPTVTGIKEDAIIKKIWNEIQYFSVEGQSLDAEKIQYSLDGGLTWSLYKDCINNFYGLDVNEQKVALQGGAYYITVRQMDKAGNVSDASDIIDLTINSTFPAVTEININKTDGNYKKDEVVKINVFLENEVEPYKAMDAELTFVSQKDNTMSRTIKVNPSEIATNKLVFEYKITEYDDFKGVNITAVNLGNIQDKYNNKQQTETTSKIASLLNEPEGSGGKCQRSGLVLDGKPPVIQTFGTTKNAINASTSNKAGTFKLTFTFNENIRKESGKIYLQRKGNWAIPSVLTTSEFNSIYNKVKTVTDKEKLMKSQNSNASIPVATDTRTGQPVGPYKKITHGLKVVDGKYVPDTETKYVLDFNLDIFETTGNVSDIRNVLKGIDYDKHFVEVNTSNVKLTGSNEGAGLTSNVLEISFIDDIPDGIEWELHIPNNSFYDITGNAFKGFVVTGETGYTSASDEQKYNFFSNKVSTPVIRVDRYSHGWGAEKKNADNSVAQTISAYQGDSGSRGSTVNTNNSGRTIAPWGFVDVKIDCATVDAVVKYNVVNGGTYSMSTVGYNTHNNNKTYTIDDVSKTTLESTSLSNNYTTQFYIGEARDSTSSVRYDTARKDYVVARASKTGYENSDNAYEGVFKTVVVAGYNSNQDRQTNVEGGTAEGGEPIVSGFPVRDATKDDRYSKNMYRPNNSGNYYYWVSYEIVSDWAILLERTNYSQTYPKSTYGSLKYLYNLEHYN